MRRASELFDSQPRSPEDEKRKREVGSITCYLEKGGGGSKKRGESTVMSASKKVREEVRKRRGRKNTHAFEKLSHRDDLPQFGKEQKTSSADPKVGRYRKIRCRRW